MYSLICNVTVLPAAQTATPFTQPVLEFGTTYEITVKPELMAGLAALVKTVVPQLKTLEVPTREAIPQSLPDAALELAQFNFQPD